MSARGGRASAWLARSSASLTRSSAWLARRVRPGGADRGSASVFVLGLIVALLLVAGLVVDGGRAVNARAAALDAAEQAARSGANQVDEGTLRATGEVRIDAARAQDAAADFLAAAGYDVARASVQADEDRVSVSVEADTSTALLSLIGIHTFEVRGAATARAAAGIVDEIAPQGGP